MEMKFEPKEVIVDSLKATGRENIEALIDYMGEIGFFTAPCSSQFHLCEEGGLAKHSCNVLFNAERIGVALLGAEEYNKVQNSVVIAALLHDLGKCGDFGKQMYVENTLKSGKKSTAKPFKTNSALTNVPHAIRSVKIATLFIDLTEDEEWAILSHDGLYDFMKYQIPGHETPLSMIIHMADLWSSKVTENDGKQQEEEE